MEKIDLEIMAVFGKMFLKRYFIKKAITLTGSGRLGASIWHIFMWKPQF